MTRNIYIGILWREVYFKKSEAALAYRHNQKISCVKYIFPAHNPRYL